MYWVVAIAVSYATWPYLWGAPIAHFVESVRTLADFPFKGDTLYLGNVADSPPMPWHYVPLLILIQLTLPLLILTLLGLVHGLFRTWSGSIRRIELAMILLWFIIPLFAVIGLRSPIYGNQRQLLFVLPPLFALGGIGLDLVSSRIHSGALSGLMILIVALPGVIGILRLHPYEYIFYNSVVGGVRGAFRSFELDYWCTSYREAMGVVNGLAPRDAVIAVDPPVQLAQEFARPDLKVLASPGGVDADTLGADFGISCTRANLDLGFLPRVPIVAEIQADGGVLAVIKDLRARK
jgi:hypothetical protein